MFDTTGCVFGYYLQGKEQSAKEKRGIQRATKEKGKAPIEGIEDKYESKGTKKSKVRDGGSSWQH